MTAHSEIFGFLVGLWKFDMHQIRRGQLFSSVELAIMQPRTDPVELAITQYVVEWTSHIAKPVGFGEIKSIVFRFIMIVFLA